MTETTTEHVDVGESTSASALSAHYHASRLRTDTWNELKRLAIDLAKRKEPGPLVRKIEERLAVLAPIESYWAFPGRDNFAFLETLFEERRYGQLARATERLVRALASHSYRGRSVSIADEEEFEEQQEIEARDEAWTEAESKAYFELLVVDNLSSHGMDVLRQGLRDIRRREDPFLYEPVIVRSFEGALIATLFNYNIQAVVIRYDFPVRSRNKLEVLEGWLAGIDERALAEQSPIQRASTLARLIRELRPELDLYLVTDASVEEAPGTGCFRRVFYRQEDYLELHLSVLRGVRLRRSTPFFEALRDYAEQPTGVFHAMPISRAKSILKSHWIRDMVEFYGINIFLAETSATSGGLDSLLDPHGPIRDAQTLAARAFGARRTYFVTNGTTGANKIVCQALVRPGDIVLVDRDCHKSHHYALVLAGAEVVYLDAYPLHEFSMYGAVPLSEITRTLRELEAAGKLDRVRLLILTNCTFDGIVYHPERVMEECLAIKPDLIFLWDEAWFAFASFSPTYRRRTAMYSARRLRERYKSAQYAAAYAAAEDRTRMPDPERVRVRVYATQSTHKTLTALRQGSMIHVHDQAFNRIEGAFRDAYMTHTSTSPNYQVLASLDLGRRQVELEGFEMVGKQIELALILRERIVAHPVLRRWFRFLRIKDMIPDGFRPSGIESYYDKRSGWNRMERAWQEDEFVLDPTRLTLYIGATGIDGDTFKNVHLMRRHGIQVNKTSRNTVLFMTNIGTSRSSVAHLIEVLLRLAEAFDRQVEDESLFEKRARERAIRRLTEEVPPLPDFSHFHERFRRADGSTPEGDLRTAFFLGTDEDTCEYMPIEEGEIDEVMRSGRELVAASFVTPYPPGFPILVPGQVVSSEILAYMRALDTKEIHGYRAELGLRVFTQEAIGGGKATR